MVHPRFMLKLKAHIKPKPTTLYGCYTMASATETLQQSPLAYFLAGMLVSATYFYFTNSKDNDRVQPINNLDEDDWDDESEDHDANHPFLNNDNPSSSWGYMDAPYKMVLCVNQDLGMGKGKRG